MKQKSTLWLAVRLLGFLAVLVALVSAVGGAYLVWLDSSSAARRTKQFCVTLRSSLEACEALGQTCIPTYHKNVTSALADAKRSPADIFTVAVWLEHFDQLYLEGKMIAQQIQSGGLDESARTRAIQDIKETCQGLVNNAEL